MIEPPVPIIFPNESRWRPKLGPALVSALLWQMARQDVIAIERTVPKVLGLPGRRERSALRSDEDEDEGDGALMKLNRYRWHNRALAMELLAALLLSYLNRAKEVRSFCLADGARPYHFAGSGLPDVVAEYPESKDAPPFRVLGEVSAKREISLEWHLGQLDGALRHARSVQEEFPGPHIHVWLINNADVDSDAALRRQYQEFVRDNGLLARDSAISMVSMHTWDAAYALGQLWSEPPAGGARFPSGKLTAALGGLARKLANDPPGTKGWMAESFLESLGVQASVLDSDYAGDDDLASEDEDGPPGTR